MSTAKPAEVVPNPVKLLVEVGKVLVEIDVAQIEDEPIWQEVQERASLHARLDDYVNEQEKLEADEEVDEVRYEIRDVVRRLHESIHYPGTHGQTKDQLLEELFRRVL